MNVMAKYFFSLEHARFSLMIKMAFLLLKNYLFLFKLLQFSIVD